MSTDFSLSVLVALVSVFKVSSCKFNKSFNAIVIVHASLYTGSLVYVCDVDRTTGSTVWRGSAFNQCLSLNKQIVLLHRRGDNETQKSCEEIDILASITFVNDSIVVSQVVFNVTSNITGSTVACYYDDGTSEILVRNFTVFISSSK